MAIFFNSHTYIYPKPNWVTLSHISLVVTFNCFQLFSCIVSIISVLKNPYFYLSTYITQFLQGYESPPKKMLLLTNTNPLLNSGILWPQLKITQRILVKFQNSIIMIINRQRIINISRNFYEQNMYIFEVKVRNLIPTCKTLSIKIT